MAKIETTLAEPASPMAYMFDGKEHIAVVNGGNLISFALPDK